LGDKIKANEVDGAIACIMEKINAYRVLVWKLEGKRQLGRPRSR
jgi:hypothetical protein